MFGRTQPPSNLLVRTTSPLSDAECEAFFFQMLEGVESGWGSGDVQRFFAALADRADEAHWKSWLKHLDARLDTGETLPAPIPQRLIRYGEANSDEIAQRARDVGKKAQEKLPAASEAATFAGTDGEGEATSGETATASAATDTPDRDPAVELAAWIERGKTQLDRAKFASALLALDMAVTIDPGSRDAWMYRGDALVDLKRSKEAIKCYERALQIAPDTATLWSRLGEVQYDLKRYALAIQSWKRALSFNETDAQAWANQGIAHGLGLNNWTEAIACWDRAVALEPENPDIWFRLGVGYGAQEQWDAALENWTKALELDPTMKDARTNQAIALDKLGRSEEAEAARDRIRAIEAGANPAAPVATAAPIVAPALPSESDPPIADPDEPTEPATSGAAEPAAASTADVAREFFQRGIEQYEQQNFQAALRFFDRAADRHPEPSHVRRYRGLTLKELGRREEAISAWERVLADEPDNADLLALVALTLQELEHWEAANTTWDRVVELLPDNRDAWIQKGITLQKLQRYDEAIAANNRAMKQ